MLVILHAGQTGVERGAHRAATATAIFVAGFMPLDKRDELGPIPREIAEVLTPCPERGVRSAVRSNIKIASAVLLVVPDQSRVERFTAMTAVLQAIRAARIPSLICDPATNLADVTTWGGRVCSTSGSRRILVTGPRETRWMDGESVARRMVTAIGMTLK
ncbi:MAG TPA: putative molybdenum carrier protein [Kofleriaceae bacterium]|nr:putative molybdenum carrier protein [Kofleriaceae bacterium]